jgi:hypothetical protein
VNVISAASVDESTVEARKVTMPPEGFEVITGALASSPRGQLIDRLVTVGPTTEPVKLNVAVWMSAG